MTFDQALNKLPDGTGFDSFAHRTVEDLCYLCLHELDLVAEREFYHPAARRRQYLNFCKKYGFYADQAQAMFNAAAGVTKADCCDSD